MNTLKNYQKTPFTYVQVKILVRMVDIYEFTYFKDSKDIMNEIPFEKMDNIYDSENLSYPEVIKADGELIWYTLLMCKSYMNFSKLFEYII